MGLDFVIVFFACVAWLLMAIWFAIMADNDFKKPDRRGYRRKDYD